MFRYTPLIILLTGLIGLISIYYYISTRAQAKDDLRFETAVQQITAKVDERLLSSVTVLRTTTALFAASTEVSQDEFKTFTGYVIEKNLYPGLQGLGYAQRVQNTQKDEFVTETTKNVDENFSIRPEAEKDEYYPVVFWETLTSSDRTIIGYDMYSDRRREAMDKARDLGLVVATGKINVFPEQDVLRREGFIMYSPVYINGAPIRTVAQRREAIIGFIFSTFFFDELIDKVMTQSMKEQIYVRMYEGSKSPDNLIYQPLSAEDTRTTFLTPRLMQEEKIVSGGKTWLLSFTTMPYFYRDSDIHWLPFLLTAAAVVTAILFIFAHWQWTTWKKTVEVTNTLQKSQQELLRLEKQKDEFISIASHELKTPLTSIKAFAQLLEDNLKKSRNALNKGIASKITQQVDKITELVNDLLDVSHLQNGQVVLRKETIDLRTLVDKTIDELLPVTEHEVQYVEATAPLIVQADPYRISQVITNFFTNAAKYSPENKKIIVRVVEDADRAVFSVQDFGIGIEKNNLSNIFHKFFRARKGKQQAGGLGLGLYISAQIIRQHGGEIWVKSKRDKGSTFYFSLPLL